MTGHVRVLVADQDLPTRAGVRHVLEQHGFEVCGEAADAASAVATALATRPDICLVEVDLPGDGLAAAAELSSRVPETVVVMLTASTDDSDLFAALRGGAMGYLLKDMNSDRLAAALRGVLDGEAAVPRTLVARLIEEYRRRDRPRRLPIGGGDAAELTEREWEVLGRMRDGLSTAEIAQELGVSPVTVRRHVSEMLRKLRVPDREAALRLAQEHSRQPRGAAGGSGED